MFWRSALTAAAVACLTLASGAEANTDCNKFYEVARGDTLSKISRRFDGVPDARRIHEINRETIGRDAGLIEIGMKLWIPCADGGAPPAEVVTGDSRFYRRGAMLVLSGPPRAPLIGPDLPGYGMMAEMMAEIAAGGGFAVETPAHAPATGADLVSLLTLGGFDIGFPWTEIDCAEFGADALRREACDKLVFSEPFYDVEMGMFADAGGRFAEVAKAADLAGARICRPASMGVDDLETPGLPEGVEVLRLDSGEACLAELGAGRVDLISMDTALAEILLEREGFGEEIRKAPFTTRQMLRAVMSRDHPEAEAIVAEINRGLERLRRSGQWFTIAHSHLARFPKLVQRVQPRG